MSEKPTSTTPPPATDLHGLDPGELIARGLHTVKPSASTGPWQPPTPEELAVLLPQYRIESLLGHGGMGAVYQGTQVALDRPIAIKLLPAELAADEQFIVRFQREARTLAKLQHSSIVTVYDFGQTSAGHLYFVMEYVDGTDLQRILKGPGLKPEQAFELIAQVCEALHYAHRQGVIHRDIKPANILITKDGRAKVADFGLARPVHDDTGGLTGTNVIMGTPDYMAPESRSGVAPVDHRADIFALGVMLYEMLTGQRPQGAFQPPSQRVQVDVRIDEVVLKALQQEPDRRYQQASEMKVDVDRIRTTPPEKEKSPRKPPEKGLLIAGAVILVIILAASWAVHRWSLQTSSSIVATAFPATAPQSNPVPPLLKGPDWKPLSPPDAASVQAKSDGGWFQATSWNVNQQNIFADGAIRIQTRWTERGWIYMNLRLTGGRGVELRINSLGRVQLNYNYDGQEKGRREMQLPALKEGQQVTLQLAAVGTAVIARVDDRQLTLPGLLSSWVGNMRIGGGTGETAVWIKPGEFLDLDGTADPLRTLGWEVPALGPAPVVAASSSATVATATKDAPFVNTLGMKFVPVPITGGPTGGRQVLFSVWDTRVQDYEAFVKETRREWPRADFEQGPSHPAVRVSWEDAQLFCQWLTEREQAAGRLPAGFRYRLPSDHEWSCAVELGAKEDAAKLPSEKSQKLNDTFPWGTEWPPPKGAGNFAGEELQPALASGKFSYIKEVIAGYNDGFVNTSPVGSFAANRFGLYDLDGNVWQWCEDWFQQEQKGHVLRGAGWRDGNRIYLLSSRRRFDPPGGHYDSDGFRCVLAPAAFAPPVAAASVPAAGSAPVTATQDAPFVNTLGMKFVPVPILGGPTGGQRVLFGIWDTRVQDYAEFVKETKRAWPKTDFEQSPTHPAVMVSWEDAQLFCQWLTKREQAAGRLPTGFSYRLPSDHEWSCAVELGAKEDATALPGEKNQKFNDTFPWGSEWLPPKGAGNYAGEELQSTLAAGNFSYVKAVIAGYNDGFVNTSPVGSFAANRFGLYDMGGNVWQWCEDWFDKEQKDRVLRGAAWNGWARGHLLSSARTHGSPSTTHSLIYGFRCVLALDSVSTPPATAAPSSASVSTPAAATKEGPFANTLGMKFVPVPIPDGPTRGQRVLFSIWDTRVQDYAAYARVNKVDDAWTKQQRDGVPMSRDPDDPVVGVSWEEAKAFCQWLTDKESAEGRLPKGFKYRLPTDEEWSWAVGLPPETGATPWEKSGKNNVDFPWGKDWPPTRKVGNYGDETFRAKFPMKEEDVQNGMKNQPLEGYNDGYATTSPVGSFPANAYGLYDMGGNVWQWCGDWSDDSCTIRVLRGSCLHDWVHSRLLSSARYRNAPTHRDNAYGFRCVLAPGPIATPPAASAPTPAAATKDAPFTNALGMKFVPVPITGGPTSGQRVLFSIWETRAVEYERFVAETKRPNVRHDYSPSFLYPASNLSWEEATAFCAWLTEHERKAGQLSEKECYRLPTDHEWSCAVGIGGREDAAKTPEEKDGKIDTYPWGNAWPPPPGADNLGGEELPSFLEPGRKPFKDWLVGYRDNYPRTAPVGSFAPNALGLYDLGGNLREWCEDLFNPSGTDRVMRGSAWLYSDQHTSSSSYRCRISPSGRSDVFGFRCVLAPTSSTPSELGKP